MPGRSIFLAALALPLLFVQCPAEAKSAADHERDAKGYALSRSDWGHSGDSFPSGHVTAAFAAAQVFADSRPAGDWQWRALAYSLAVATAYARVNDNIHWTSDVVAGAALGIATGRFVSGREDSARRSRVSFYVEPLDRGAVLSFSIEPR